MREFRGLISHSEPLCIFQARYFLFQYHMNLFNCGFTLRKQKYH